MLYRALRPLLFRMDAERAHHLALSLAAGLARSPGLSRCLRQVVARPADRPLELLGLKFPNRIGLAAGLDKNAVAAWAWWAFGFGFIELGTVTPRPQPGNPRPRMFRLQSERALVNRMGFNNDGAEAVRSRLEALAGRRPPFPIAISVGKNATTPIAEAETDYRRAAEIVAPVADILTINISSPNTPGLRSLQTPDQAARLITVIRQVSAGRAVLVKFAPELAGADLKAVVDECLSAGAAGFIATNTLSTRSRPELPEGGLSGPPVGEIAAVRVAEIRRRMGDRGVLIGCGGIDSPATAQRMLDAGADLIQMYTALVYGGPWLASRLSRQLLKPRGTAPPASTNPS